MAAPLAPAALAVRKATVVPEVKDIAAAHVAVVFAPALAEAAL